MQLTGMLYINCLKIWKEQKTTKKLLLTKRILNQEFGIRKDLKVFSVDEPEKQLKLFQHLWQHHSVGITCPKLTIKTLEKGMKYLQS